MILTYYTATTLIIIAYLLGSIPSAVWIGKKYYGIDIREHGSKNAGTTNMLRVLGKRAALPVFGLDVLKGFVAVTIIDLMKYDSVFADGANETWFYILRFIAVFAAVLGHIFPIFAGFRGDARRRHHGRKRPAGAALLRRLVPRADDYALRIAGLDGRRMQLPHFHAHFAESEPSGSVRRVLVHHRRAADLHAPQKYRKAQGRHGIENLHLETPPRETAAPQAGKERGIKTAQKAPRQGLRFKT